MVPEHGRWLIWLVLLLPAMVLAHKPSDSYLTLDLHGQAPQLRWDIALRDLEQALGLDADGDRLLTWAEVQRGHAAIARYAQERLAILAGGSRCRMLPGRQRLVDHSDGTYTVLPVHIDCDGARPTELRYDLLFAIDPSHRGLLRTLTRDGERLQLLSPEQPVAAIDTGALPGMPRLFAQQLRDGMLHIPRGLDHVLFLLTLMLPAVMLRRDGRWHAVQSGRRIGRNVLSVVTAFTIAHSITLSLAVFGVVLLPGRWVEPAIALTVLLAALNNVRPFLPGRPWAIAFALGLVHGFGFASALTDLGLSGWSMAAALAAFNIGVELGQILIVLLILPIAWTYRATRIYRVAGLQLGSAAIAVVAVVWLLERSLHLQLIPL